MVPPALSGVKLKALPHVLRLLAKLPQPLAAAVKRGVAP
jgi:acetolactate synthase-1/2/3 large subunit